jgi:hypothetical protein
MRVVIVNHLHPRSPQVGGVRLPRFADALAARGHRIVLLTGLDEVTGQPPDPVRIVESMARHDWAMPFHLPCAPRPSPILTFARERHALRPLRQAVLAWHYLFHGGVFTDWRLGTEPYWAVLAQSFRPDVTWATFGNTDAWAIARGIARRAGCPWVMDLKDVWDAFVPRPVASLVLSRFRDAAACTGLSRAHLNDPAKHLGLVGSVIYSGIPLHLLRPTNPEMPFRITVTGSSYGWLDAMVGGVDIFLDQLPEAERTAIVFTYAGGEHEAAAQAARKLAGRCRIDVRPYIPLDELAGLQRQAFLNLYGRATGHPDFFHHKLVELLCADRPIACYPGETPEAMEVAARVRGQLRPCADQGSLARVLMDAWQSRRPEGIGSDRGALAGYTWEAQAERLEAVFERVRTCP